MKKLAKTALIGSLSCLMASPVLADLNTGLVAHFPFSGSMEDVSGHGYRGSAIGGVTLTTDRDENEESAYYFSDNAYIQTNIDGSRFSSNEMSYSLWFQGLHAAQTSGWPGPSKPAILISNEGHWLQVAGTIGYGSVDRGQVVDGHKFVASLIDANKQWHHIVINYSGNKIEWFLDGMFIIDFETEEEYAFNGKRFLFGKLNPQAGADYIGKLDDIRIYNRVLSEAEVGQLYAYVPVECEACDAAREQGMQIGIQTCKTDPTACEITVSAGVGCDVSTPEPLHATYSLESNILHIPAIDIPGNPPFTEPQVFKADLQLLQVEGDSYQFHSVSIEPIE
ncbi:LamG domain-containing protein [Candidatus Parabeggiatoa sp. HSG14]|uniref:LamG domain-containing protein n=1 Tax=Candidatus Parabeggiatoa sp. HSG14 TaxID=3055593 RepID=UPI0025A90B33|nr:LamG domain-containing protein [Thiotrichales bacterium HSG14]